MFKPNIRGVGRRNLRLELAGWRNRLDNSLIKHRYPWRRSWIELTAGDSSLAPVLARSGQVFLVQSSVPAMASTNTSKSSSRPKKYFAFGLISAIGVLAGVIFVPTATAKNFSADKPSHTSAAFDCRAAIENPEVEITKWLSDSSSNEVIIKELQREGIGGVQLRRINISCGARQEDFKITLTLKDKAWQLKKFTRLEN